MAIDELLVGLVPERASGPDNRVLRLAEAVGDQLMELFERYAVGHERSP